MIVDRKRTAAQYINSGDYTARGRLEVASTRAEPTDEQLDNAAANGVDVLAWSADWGTGCEDGGMWLAFCRRVVATE